MNRLKSRYTTVLLMSIICFSIIYSVYGRIVVAPNTYVLSDKGEAMRSYYVMSYHLNSDTTWLGFSGMNYPYGELLTYSDGQPATTLALKSVSQAFPSIKNYGVGYMNVLSLYSLILSAILIFLILLEFKVSHWIAVLIAISIMLLTPQVLRMKWQPALATSCFIPLSFYLFVKWMNVDSLKWKLLLAANTLFWYFIHPYLGLMQTVFLIVAFSISRLATKKRFQWKQLIWQSVHTALPTILFFIVMKLTDEHGGRVESPMGMVQFSAYLDSIFTSPHSPFSTLYLSLFNADIGQFYEHFEGAAYIGVIGTLALLSLPIMRVFYRKHLSELMERLPVPMKIIAWTSSILLIFSFALPFKWFPSTIDWLDVVPPLKQFRALGRFSWFFMYAVHLLLGLGLSYWFTKSFGTRKRAVGILFVGLITITCWEGINLHKFAAENSNTVNLLNDQVSLSMDEKLSIEEAVMGNYQALVPIPFFHIGSHRLETKSHFDAEFLRDFLVFSKRAQLPTTASFLSRNSLHESISAFQFFSSPMIKKQLENNLPSKRDVLLYCSKSLAISQEEQRVINLGKVVFENERFQLIALSPSEVFKNESQNYLKAFREHRDLYQQKGNSFVNKGGWAEFVSPGEASKIGFWGEGRKIELTTKGILFDQRKDLSDSLEGKCSLSFWFEHSDQRSNVQLKMRVTDKKTRNLIEIIEVKWGLKTFDIVGNWMLCEFDLILDKEKNIEVYFEPKPHARIQEVFIDELMIRSANSSIFEKKSKQTWWWNNRPLQNYED